MRSFLSFLLLLTLSSSAYGGLSGDAAAVKKDLQVKSKQVAEEGKGWFKKSRETAKSAAASGKSKVLDTQDSGKAWWHSVEKDPETAKELAKKATQDTKEFASKSKEQAKAASEDAKKIAKKGVEEGKGILGDFKSKFDKLFEASSE